VPEGPGLRVERWGRVPYARALERMAAAVEARAAGRAPDRLFLLEHPPVVTLGRNTRPDSLRVPPAELARRGIELFEVARGGDATYHGPGQLVGYLVVDLAARGRADVGRLLRGLESCLAATVESFGVSASRIPGRTGVFVAGSDPPRKLASIGLGLRRFVTSHGFALNVTLDPAEFGVIIPCGLRDVVMTSLERELPPGGQRPAALFEEVADRVARAFRRWWS